MQQDAVTRIERQLSIESIEQDCAVGGVHYLIGCYKAPTGFYTVSCSCGWRDDTGKSAGTAHALLRAHYNGHQARAVIAPDGE